MYKTALISVLLCSLGFCYDLDNAIKDALSYNHAIRAAKEQEKVAEFSSKSAIGEFLPSVNLYVNADPTLANLSYRYNGLPNSATSSPNIGLNVKQNLFNFGGSFTKLKKGQYDYKTQKFLSQDKIQSIVLSVVGAYLDVLKLEKAVALRRENVASLKRSLDREEQKFKYGNSTKGDVAEARSKLSKAKSEYLQSLTAREEKKATFLRLVGQKANSLEQPKVSRISLPKNLEAAIETAKTNNSYLSAMYNSKKASEFAHGTAISGILPSLDAIAQFSYGDTQINGVVENRQELNRKFELRLSVPLFQGGGEYMSILAASHNRSYADQIYKDSYKALEENVTIAWNDYKNSTPIIQAALDSVEAFKISVDSLKIEEKMGLKTIDDLMDAQIGLLNAELQLIQAQNFQVNSLYKLLIIVYGNNAINIDENNQVKNKYS